MMGWEHAVPLITVIVTAFGAALGIVWGGKNREKEAGSAASGVPTAIAGAIAERGVAENLSMAIHKLASVVQTAAEDQARDRDDYADQRRKQHREHMDALDRIAKVTERERR